MSKISNLPIPIHCRNLLQSVADDLRDIDKLRAAGIEPPTYIGVTGHYHGIQAEIEDAVLEQLPEDTRTITMFRFDQELPATVDVAVNIWKVRCSDVAATIKTRGCCQPSNWTPLTPAEWLMVDRWVERRVCRLGYQASQNAYSEALNLFSFG